MTETVALPPDLDARVHRFLKAACARNLRLATAESCTGGLLASLFTDVPGCSHAFERGFVVYSNAAKHELLGVPQALLEEPGPVSEPVARALAEGALARAIADIAIATTGFAGAGAPGDEPGLVHVAVAARNRPTRHRRVDFPETDRGGVRLRAVELSLDLLEEVLDGWGR